MAKKNGDGLVFFGGRIPEQLRCDIRILAAEKRTTVQAILIEALQGALVKGKRK